MVSIQNEDIPVEELINGNFSSTTQQNNEILVSNLQTLTHTNENIRDETQLFMSQEKSSRTSILCSKQRISITVVAIILYMSISMATGVLLVYFNQPTKLIPKCELKFIRTLQNPIAYNYRPRSVATGDFNNDTWLDIAVGNYAAGNIAIFLGYGNGTFENAIIYSLGSGSTPYMVAVDDLNNDHKLDFAIANFGSNSIAVFLGLGNGSFVMETSLSTGTSRPVWINIADFNNDTKLDIVIANYGTDSISISFGSGNGRFSSPISYFIGYDSRPLAIANGDFNDDNHVDLVIANYVTNNIAILFGNGNGSFGNQTTFSTGPSFHPYSIVVSHFNDDNLLDIAVANHGTNSLGIFLGYGNGLFSSQVIYSLGTASPYSIGVGDFNKDNHLDIIVSNHGTNNIGLFFGYKNGSFTSPQVYSTGSSSSVSLAVGDFNNDDEIDITVVNNDTNSIGILQGSYKAFQTPMTYPTNSLPRSIVTGDFNNDTQLDIIVAAEWDNNIDVLFGYGNGSFANRITYSTGINPNSIAVGDFNNDTRLDVAVANRDSDNVGILHGYVNGSFAEQITYSTGADSRPYCLAVGDLNNDTRLDIVVANSNTNNVGVLLGYGNGSFAHQITYFTGTGSVPRSVGIGDFNNDGLLDIVVANYGSNNLGIFLGSANGSFSNQTTYSTGNSSSPYSLAIGDFNNDHRLDITVANFAGSNIGVFFGYGNGSFENQMTYSTGSFPSCITTGNFNNDTLLDIVVANSGSNNLDFFFGYGNKLFLHHRTYATDYNPEGIVVADFNNDARPDIVVSNSGSNNIGVLLRYDIGSLTTGITFALAGASRLRYVAVADFDKDNRLDIVVSNYGSDNIGILFGYANGTFENQLMLTTGLNSHPYAMVVGDFNNDNELDVGTANYGSKSLSMILGKGKRLFTTQSWYGSSFDSPPFALGIGDFNNDKRSEIVVAYDDIDNIDIFIAYDTGSFTTTTLSTGSYPVYISTVDLNNDKILDIIVSNFGSKTVGIFLGYSNGSFANQITYSTDNRPWTLAVGDFNHDTYQDIVVLNYYDDNVEIHFGYGNGSFSNQTKYSTGIGPIAAVVADFNNDTHLDFIIANLIDNSIDVFLGYGNASFSSQTTYSTGADSNPYCLVVADFNNDSRLDIAVGNQISNNIGIFLGYGNGSFTTQITYATGPDSNPTSIDIGDFNNDTILDIVVANFGTNNIGVFIGYGNGSFATQTTYPTGTGPQYVSVGDYNNDALLDIAIANGGDNNVGVLLGRVDGSFDAQTTYSTGTDSNPQWLTVGDFNNDGRLDIVSSNSNGNNICVLYGYASVAFIYRMTLITGNGSRPYSFAIADFNNDNHTDIVVTNSGSNNVGIFLGYGNYSFTPQTTYSVGSLPYSIAMGDFNNDNLLDITVANFGSNTLGVLLGHGNGSFSHQIMYSSDTRPSFIAVANFNNDTFSDIIVANYDTNNIGVFLGHGNGCFADVMIVSIGVGSHPFFIVVGDFNNDTKLDFAVANEGKDNLETFLQTC